MLFLNISAFLSALTYLYLFYLVSLLSLLFYLIPTLSENHFNTNSLFASKNNFYLVKGHSLLTVIYEFMLLILLVVLYSFYFTNSIWVGHVVISPFSKKIFILLFVIIMSYFSAFLSYTTFSSREIYDFFIVNVNMILWVYLLFFSNSIISTFFIIEVLSALLFLLLVSSTFSSMNFYNNLDFSANYYLGGNMPSTFLRSIIFFFWISLLSSLNLFLFTLVLYLKLFSFDWFLLEHVFYHITSTSTSKNIFLIGLTWYILLFSVFTKCGLAPFFFWKPTFFKGLTFNSIFFYISIFYFFIFLYFINFITLNFYFIFFFYHNIFLLMTTAGLLIVMFLMLEAFYLKTFFAVSSILNSLIIFLAMSSSHVNFISI